VGIDAPDVEPPTPATRSAALAAEDASFFPFSDASPNVTITIAPLPAVTPRADSAVEAAGKDADCGAKPGLIKAAGGNDAKAHKLSAVRAALRIAAGRSRGRQPRTIDFDRLAARTQAEASEAAHLAQQEQNANARAIRKPRYQSVFASSLTMARACSAPTDPAPLGDSDPHREHRRPRARCSRLTSRRTALSGRRGSARASPFASACTWLGWLPW